MGEEEKERKRMAKAQRSKENLFSNVVDLAIVSEQEGKNPNVIVDSDLNSASKKVVNDGKVYSSVEV